MPEISADLFRDKIVVIGATANAAFDVKSSPIEGIFPGTRFRPRR